MRDDTKHLLSSPANAKRLHASIRQLEPCYNIRAWCLLWLTVLLTLSGCTHTIVRDCLTKEQYEQLKSQEPPKVRDKLTGKADEDIRPITGSNLLLRSYSHTLLDALKVCSG
jgi:hypothetical protein